DLVPRVGELLAGQRVARFELEQVIPDFGRERRRGLARLELEDLRLDLGRELAALERPEGAAVLARGIVRVLPREVAEVVASEEPRVDLVGADPRGLP